MTYNPDVQPGEPATRLDLPGLTMWKLSVSDMHNNVYLLQAETGEKLLIDAAADAPAIEKILDDAPSGPLLGVVTTHQHWDHHRALTDIAKLTDQTMAGAEDADALPVAPTRELHDEDTFELGDQTLTFHHVPGHTPGSIVVSWTPPAGTDALPQLWTGDTLFPGGVGATQHDGQDFATLFSSVKDRIFGRFDDAVVHPGHGDDTVLSRERPHLDEWQERGW